ncbi:hypothetical protein C8R43DRAFT_1024989 [Mycena crocata]|nr:hypothetical protein C8R43DRAFT_1024989 [Mycena crocata]
MLNLFSFPPSPTWLSRRIPFPRSLCEYLQVICDRPGNLCSAWRFQMVASGRNLFTPDQDVLLIEYLAKCNPGVEGRCGKRLYQHLVEKAEQEWNWTSSHSWPSWRERYRACQSEFNQRIKEYQLDNGLPTKNPDHKETKPRICYTPDDDDLLIEYLAKYNPGVPGRAGDNIYQRLVEKVDEEWSWTSHHSRRGWQNRYARKRSEFDQRIRKYQLEHSLPTENAGHVNGTRGGAALKTKRKRRGTLTRNAGKPPRTRKMSTKHRRTTSAETSGLPSVQDQNKMEIEQVVVGGFREPGKEARAAHRARPPAGHYLRLVNGVTSALPPEPCTISSPREVLLAPSSASGMPSVVLQQDTSPHCSQSSLERMQTPVDQLSTFLQLPQSPIDWGSPMLHVASGVGDTDRYSSCMQSPLEGNDKIRVPPDASSHRSLSPLDWGSPNFGVLSSVELGVEPVENSDQFKIYAQHPQSSQPSPGMLDWSGLESTVPGFENIAPGGRLSSLEHDVQSTPLHTRRSPRRLRLFRPRPVLN